ncbi:MAG: hypothetical protein JO228_03605 [Xanthobacteraceae bacterium]|nr:hypothetical protein [Xanthobacteraceae bacterium]
MNDPFVIASIALGLSVVVSAVRMVDWFLHAEPSVVAQVTRWSVRGIAALSLPLLLVLLVKEQWTAATALAAAMMLVPALLARRFSGWVWPRSIASHGGGGNFRGAHGHSFADEAELVRYSAAVLEAYLRRTAAAQVGGDLPAIVDRTDESAESNAENRPSPKGEDTGGKAKPDGDAGGNGHAQTFGLGAMSEDEAGAVLGIDRGAGEAEILAVHARMRAMVDPARGGSPYLAIKVDQAKEILLRAPATRSANALPKAPRKRGAARRHSSPPA